METLNIFWNVTQHRHNISEDILNIVFQWRCIVQDIGEY
jgi:hypothetical protein